MNNDKMVSASNLRNNFMKRRHEMEAEELLKNVDTFLKDIGYSQPLAVKAMKLKEKFGTENFQIVFVMYAKAYITDCETAEREISDLTSYVMNNSQEVEYDHSDRILFILGVLMKRHQECECKEGSKPSKLTAAEFQERFEACLAIGGFTADPIKP